MMRARTPVSRAPETANFDEPALPVIDIDHALHPFAGLLHDFVVGTGSATRYGRERIPTGMESAIRA